jgi:uncharacterized protein (DUF58 family)
MKISDIGHISSVQHIELLARQVVEGFITGMHKSPFHGFSVEFSEHRLYNKGESTRHIDWKLFAKSEKLFVKRYEEETNLRSHIIIDNSASMHYPLMDAMSFDKYNKIGFAVIASAALMEILKRQRDAFGLSIYAETNEYFAPAKGNEKHRRMLLEQLQQLLSKRSRSSTNTYDVLHEIAEKIHRRSLIFLFTDMFQSDKREEELFAALRHLKYNKHEVVLFHTYDGEHELNFNFDEMPKKFVDVETGEHINLFAGNVREQYHIKMETYFKDLKYKCMQYNIDYVPVDIHEGFDQVLTTYMVRRSKFL